MSQETKLYTIKEWQNKGKQQLKEPIEWKENSNFDIV